MRRFTLSFVFDHSNNSGHAMFIQTEATPNPATLKFVPGKIVLENGTRDFRSAQEAEHSPLAQRLFAVEGVEGVFLGHDFIAVTQGAQQQASWQQIKPAVLGAIMEHYMSGAPVLNDMEQHNIHRPGAVEEEFDQKDSDIVAAIKDLLETRVRPAVAYDGGDVVFRGFRDGIVHLHMRGACAGCPSAEITLKNGIENLLRHFIPEVHEVRQC